MNVIFQLEQEVQLLKRFAMKLPSIVIAIAENQIESANYLQKNNYIEFIGSAKDIPKDWIEKIIYQ